MSFEGMSKNKDGLRIHDHISFTLDDCFDLNIGSDRTLSFSFLNTIKIVQHCKFNA